MSRIQKEEEFPKIYGKRAIAGRFRDRGGKTAVKAPLLAEQISLDPIGQGIEAEVGDSKHPAGRLQHVAG